MKLGVSYPILSLPRQVRYGVPEATQIVACPVGATQQLYDGGVALVSGGSGATAGYLKNAATPVSTDIVAGMVGDPAGATVQTGPGVLGGATDGAVWDNVLTGAFFFQSGSGDDQLSDACYERAVVCLERASRLFDMSEREPDDETANQLLELAISSAELAGEYIGLHDKIIKAMRPEVEG